MPDEPRRPDGVYEVDVRLVEASNTRPDTASLAWHNDSLYGDRNRRTACIFLETNEFVIGLNNESRITQMLSPKFWIYGGRGSMYDRALSTQKYRPLLPVDRDRFLNLRQS